MDPSISERTPLLSNKAYDRMKYVAQIFLPAVGALYFGLAQIWGLPYAEEIVGSITVIDVFLGAVLLLSTKQYDNSSAKYDGNLIFDEEDPDRRVLRFEVDAPLEDIAMKENLTIKVHKPV